MSEQKHDAGRMARIHIDRVAYHSPNPTTGEALYLLGNVPAGHELFREVHGDREDAPVQRGDEHIHLTEDEHFYSAEKRPTPITIIVNARKKTVPGPDVTFEQIVGLAFDTPPGGENLTITVAFRKGVDGQEGTMRPGESIKVKEGMIFDVTATNRS